VFLLERAGQGEATASQHPQADFVKRNRIADPFGQGQAVTRARRVQSDDQTAIVHGVVPFNTVIAAYGDMRPHRSRYTSRLTPKRIFHEM